jgi:hypothetical protein
MIEVTAEAFEFDGPMAAGAFRPEYQPSPDEPENDD